jgi:hypothetical protein
MDVTAKNEVYAKPNGAPTLDPDDVRRSGLAGNWQGGHLMNEVSVKPNGAPTLDQIAALGTIVPL